MIASWRALAVAAALAVVLVIAVVIDPGRTRGTEDRALVPGFDPGRVTELVWERAGQPAIHVARDADGWETRAPAPTVPSAVVHVPVDPSAVGEVLAALRGARWHRRGDPPPIHATLTVVAGAQRHVLGIAAPIAGTEQTWLVDDGRGVVVDSWVARALDRDLLALRITTPLADIRRAQTISIEGEFEGQLGGHVALHIDGHPRRLDLGGKLVIAADLADQLERVLGAVTIVRIPDGPSGARGLSIFTGDEDLARSARAVVHLVLGGSCPGAPELIAVSGTDGDGCVERAAAEAVEHAVGRLQQPPAAIVERRLVPFEPTRIVLADGVALDITALRAGEHPAEPAHVAELLAALAAPAEVAALPAAPATQHLIVTDHTGAEITLDLFAGHVVARHGELIALAPAPGAWNLLVRPSRELRDVTPWLEEPTTITTVRIDDVSYQRGAIIGDWTRRPGGTGDVTAGVNPADTKTLEALVGTLAAPRSLGFVDDQLPVVHRVVLVVAPPTGAPFEHTLALGAPRASGCPAHVDRDSILLPASVCAQVAALAK